MKNLYMLLILILIAWLSLTQLSSCQEEDVLPPITMEGKHTFGCMVNGELWLPKGRLGSSGFGADITKENFLVISADNDISGISLVINDTADIVSNKVYSFSNNSNYYGRYNIEIDEKNICFYDSEHLISGTLILSKFNKQVISGTFEFTSYNPNCGDTIKVTDGRFDIGRIAY